MTHLDGVWAQLNERRARYTASMRRAMGQWLLHMIDLGFATETEVARAMTHAHPYGALDRLYNRSCTRLTRHLNQTVEQHALGGGKPFRRTLEVALTSDADGEDAAITLGLGGYYEFDVSTLHQVPAELAGMVHECLTLIARSCVECLLPIEMWDGECMGANEDLRAEFDELRPLAATENLETVAEFALAHDLYHFQGSPDELRAQLDCARLMFDERPRWMEHGAIVKPVDHARRLRRRASRYQRAYGAHPWGAYVQYACTVIAKHYRNEQDLLRYRARRRDALLDQQDNAMPLAFAFWINSGSQCERRNAEGYYDCMSQGGETTEDRYALRPLASPQLRQILEQTATGIGLLLRASGVNAQVEKLPR